ncbi:hypothetical protein [Azotobacter beijerinckii]|uniref:Uncharacterized protein n=1 Tax=Azotobacter beijerinckii TaxID=170623 RepID=A0A1I4GFE0_9GAMM|nr:hypothetical protein [Azotobacter beijerinckii]SFL28725.1 hypothetical protein SAMN04244574_03817 [Azotobacter beijerinckii]
MIELQHISRLLCSALAAALLVGCASKEPQGPQITLQDPEQTPREKWSDAMKILRDDLGIKGMKDVPVETARQYGLIASASEPIRGSQGSMGDLAFGSMGVALFLIPTGQVTQPWQQDQAVAWVPIEKANNMDEAIKFAIDTWNQARSHAFNDPSPIKVNPSVVADFASGQYANPKDIFLKNPIPPAGNPINGPSFVKIGKYYGPIFMGDFQSQVHMDAKRSKMNDDEGMLRLSERLPNWFVIFNSGQKPVKRITAGYPPAILISGKAFQFIGK